MNGVLLPQEITRDIVIQVRRIPAISVVSSLQTVPSIPVQKRHNTSEDSWRKLAILNCTSIHNVESDNGSLC